MGGGGGRYDVVTIAVAPSVRRILINDSVLLLITEMRVAAVRLHYGLLTESPKTKNTSRETMTHSPSVFIKRVYSL